MTMLSDLEGTGEKFSLDASSWTCGPVPAGRSA